MLWATVFTGEREETRCSPCCPPALLLIANVPTQTWQLPKAFSHLEGVHIHPGQEELGKSNDNLCNFWVSLFSLPTAMAGKWASSRR